MPKTRAQKSAEIADLAAAMKTAKAAAFADYQGMSVQNITTLRKKMHAEGVDYIVAKKTLMAIAAKEAGFDVDFKSMPGMLSVALAKQDEMAPAKLIGDAGKDQPIKLVGGIFEGKVVDQAYIVQLSKLPSKSQLLTQLLYVFNGPVGAFARLLNAYREQKEAGAPPAPAPAPVAEAPKAEESAPAAEPAPTPEAPAADAPAQAETPAAS
ncbi:50S ribosomal protein L10 [Candidatus Uhrbacteria bacterium]|nr:50S ribosomal protein L10 [Candidatus Uhrbacteria bacterium]